MDENKQEVLMEEQKQETLVEVIEEPVIEAEPVKKEFNAGKESRTKDMTPDSWEKRYKRIRVSTKFFLWFFLIVLVVYMIFSCRNIYASSIATVTACLTVLICIPLSMQLEYVYLTREILDVDGDAIRYDEVLSRVAENACFFQSGWVNTERVRAKIAKFDIEGAEVLLNSYQMRTGFTKYYIVRQIELRGICAILKNNTEQYEKCISDLDELYKKQSKCSCFYNSSQSIENVKNNWKYLINKRAITLADGCTE